MLRVHEGDKEAFALLYEQYSEAVGCFLLSHSQMPQDLEGLVQEVFVRAWCKRKDYRGESSDKTYLFSIARNTLFEHQRALRKEKKHERLDDHSQKLHLNIPLEQDLVYQEFEDAVSKAISSLPMDQRNAIELILIHDNEYGQVKEELSGICGKSAVVQTTKGNETAKNEGDNASERLNLKERKRLSRARQRLRKALLGWDKG